MYNKYNILLENDNKSCVDRYNIVDYVSSSSPHLWYQCDFPFPLFILWSSFSEQKVE